MQLVFAAEWAEFAVAIESEPGNVFVFHQRVLHLGDDLILQDPVESKPAPRHTVSMEDGDDLAPIDQTIAITGMGIELPADEQNEYDNSHVARALLQTDGEGGFYLPVNIPVGTKLSLMQRDEEKIFQGVERMMDRLNEKVDGREIVAVFHADCLARGRFTFDRVLKEEIIAKMQYPLVQDQEVPWLGLYGYSEFCPLGGKNQFHSFTTSIFPLVRRRAD